MKSNTPLDAVIYCRNACANQPDSKDRLASQEVCCREYAAHQRYNVVHIFRDEGISGVQAERPGVQGMVSFLKEQSGARPCVVIIDDMSRLARSHDAHAQITTAIRDAGGRLESPSINFSEALNSRLVQPVLPDAAVSKRSSKWTNQQGKHDQ